VNGNNLSPGRFTGNAVQVGRDVTGDVVFHRPRHASTAWFAFAAVALLGLALVAVWRVDALRVTAVAGAPRPASAAGTGLTATPPGRVPPDPQRALAPLDITTREAVPQTCRHGRVVPETRSTTIPVRQPELWPPDSVLGDGGHVEVTVQGRHGTAVVLHSVRVEVVSRRPPMRGAYLPGTCGSSRSPRHFDVDLAQRAPKAAPRPGRDGPTVHPTVPFPFMVSSTDPEVLVFTGLSPDEDVEWRLHLRWSSAGETRETRVDDDDRPFRTTSTRAAEPWCWTYEGLGGNSGWAAPGVLTGEDVQCPG